ncbi:MAG: glycosyltransferase family 39 protein [Candidatus Yanofskybacteria bacterium]|nr:glycosyltransferase family 39 protein [Candidatus Yanofskybacteria bacterium]
MLSNMVKSKGVLFALLGILLLASFFRLWQLDTLPPGLWPDEAINATTAVEILQTGEFQVFYPENHGREGFFFLLISFAFGLFGVSVWAFKIVPALIGILTVLGQFLLTRELFGQIAATRIHAAKIALLSSFFLAVSVWHIMFSRIGFRAILLPLVLVFSSYFLFRGMRTKKILDFILAGLIFGLGFHTYISFRLGALAVALALLLWLILAIKERWGKEFLFKASAFSLFALLSASPILWHFLNTPEDFLFRASGISVFAQEQPLKALGESTLKHLAMFNIAGDQNWRHNVAGQAQLPAVVGIFFLIGLGAFMANTIKAFAVLVKTRMQGEASRAFLIGAFVLAWLFFLLLPGVLTSEGIPHALRVIGMIPALYLLAGFGALISFRFLLRLPRGQYMQAGAISLVLLGTTLLSFHSYFILWKQSPELEESFTLRFMDVGHELNSYPKEIQKYVVMSEGDLPREVPRFIQYTENRQEAIYLHPEEVATTVFMPGDLLFTMNKEARFLALAREQYPNGILHERERIWIYEIQ